MLKTNNWLDILSVAVSSFFVVTHLNMYNAWIGAVSAFYWLLIIVASIACMYYKQNTKQLTATIWVISRAISQVLQVVLVWWLV